MFKWFKSSVNSCKMFFKRMWNKVRPLSFEEKLENYLVSSPNFMTNFVNAEIVNTDISDLKDEHNTVENKIVEEVNDVIDNFDFSDEIDKRLDRFDFDQHIEKALENFDWTEPFNDSEFISSLKEVIKETVAEMMTEMFQSFRN